MGQVMHTASLSPRGLAATALAGLALLLAPASASAQEPAPVGDAPQFITVTGSGRPDADLDLFRTREVESKPRAKRARRGKPRAAVFGKRKRTQTGRISILL